MLFPLCRVSASDERSDRGAYVEEKQCHHETVVFGITFSDLKEILASASDRTLRDHMT